MAQNNRIQVEIPISLRASYSNLALISHTPTEFFVDFAQLLPGTNKSQVHTRVVMTPTHAKLLFRALGENLERFEAKHGEVTVPPSLADQLFGSLRTEGGTEGEGDGDGTPG
jgi:hypothetical protein